MQSEPARALSRKGEKLEDLGEMLVNNVCVFGYSSVQMLALRD